MLRLLLFVLVYNATNFSEERGERIIKIPAMTRITKPSIGIEEFMQIISSGRLPLNIRRQAVDLFMGGNIHCHTVVTIIKEVFQNINETFFHMDFKIFYTQLVSYLVNDEAGELESHPEFDIIRSTADCAEDCIKIIAPSYVCDKFKVFAFQHYEIYARKDAFAGLSIATECREDSFSLRSLNEQLKLTSEEMLSILSSYFDE